MNIGKYVDRIDKNITNVMNTQKNYSILLQNLRKDVEEFTIDYVKYLKDVENEENNVDLRQATRWKLVAFLPLRRSTLL